MQWVLPQSHHLPYIVFSGYFSPLLGIILLLCYVLLLYSFFHLFYEDKGSMADSKWSHANPLTLDMHWNRPSNCMANYSWRIPNILVSIAKILKNPNRWILDKVLSHVIAGLWKVVPLGCLSMICSISLPRSIPTFPGASQGLIFPRIYPLNSNEGRPRKINLVFVRSTVFRWTRLLICIRKPPRRWQMAADRG